ncbi:hypothetical protein KKE92_05760 [Candidatus Micrarchaeota archaeon]|nr:hypothetical protein [Candidatus Micrarchaeota archaeon]MBU1681222.1 hypothetical protein [Candidatus Micrarchaeota archaeon]
MIKKIITLSIYLILSLLIIFPILGPGYYLTLDMQWGPETFSPDHFGSLYGEVSNPYGAYLPFELVFAALAQFVSVEVVQKLLLLFILFFSGVSAHYSLPSKLGNNRFVAGFFYLLNSFVFVRFLAGHWSVLLSYAFWPFAIKYFYEFLEKPGDRSSLVKCALLTFIASVSSHALAILLLAYAILFILYYVMKTKEPQLLIKRTAALGLIIVTLNLFWILPTILTFDETYSLTSSSSDYLEDFGARANDMSLEQSVFSLHGFWRGGFRLTKDFFDLWYVPFAFLVIIAGLGIYQLLKTDLTKCLFLTVSFVVAFLLALGASSPVSFIFDIFGDTIPIYFFFRDSQKFVGLIALVYAIAGAYGSFFLSQKFTKFFFIMPLLAILLSNFGFLWLNGQITATEYPDDWQEAKLLMANDTSETNILSLPLHLYRPYPWVNSFSKTMATPASQFFSKPVITASTVETQNVYSDSNSPITNYLTYLFENREHINNTAEYLLPLNARYILLFKDDTNSIHYLWLFYRHQGIENIELIYESPSFYLFRNNLATGPFFSSKENGSSTLSSFVGSNMYSSEVEYEKVSPNKYQITNSSYDYTVYSGVLKKSYYYSGGELSKWHNVATVFDSSNGAVFENRMMQVSAILFALSWFVLLYLILNPSVPEIVFILFLFFVIIFLILEGIVLPAIIGTLYVLSFITSLIWLLFIKNNVAFPKRF